MAGPRKIGVLTFHRCINYGSYWQAACLVNGLRKMGYEAVLLDHHSSSVDRREWRCALDPQLPVRSSAQERNLYSRKIRKFLHAFETLPLSHPFDLDEPGALESWDVVLVGSDEVWNLRHPWYGGQPTFYGTGIKAIRLTSYAASFGNQNSSQPLPECWANALSNFTLISVRDQNSARIVHDALGFEPELVLDPCLQFPPAIEPRRPADARTYVAVYGHGFPAWFSDAVRRWARAAGHRLLSIGYANDWADEQLISAGPRSFAEVMAGATAVVTNFFHGCVFALVNAKPFACVSSEYRANKLDGLARLVSAERHLVPDGASPAVMQRLLESPLDRAILNRIDELRSRSQDFLHKALAP